MAELGVFQGEYNGLVFGEDTQFVISEPLGLFGWSSRVSEQAIPAGDGSVVLTDYLNSDTHVLTLTVWGHDLAEAEDNVQAVMAAFKPARGVERWLRWRSYNRTWAVRVRPTRLSAPYGFKQAQTAMFKVDVALTQADPRLYGDIEHNLRVPVFDPAAAPASYELATELPLDADASEGQGGEVLINTAGTDTAWPLISVTNTGAVDVTAVELDELASGVTFRVEDTLVAGQELIGDMSAIVRAAPAPHVHVAGASRFGSWVAPREPLGLLPAVTNRLRFSIEGAGVDPNDVVLRLIWRDTWL